MRRCNLYLTCEVCNATTFKRTSFQLILASEAEPSSTAKQTQEDVEYTSKIVQYFGTAVSEAKRMLREEEAAGVAENSDDSSSEAE